jgi:hypothetical protein
VSILAHPKQSEIRAKSLGGEDEACNHTSVWTRRAISKVTITAIASFLVVWWWLAVVLQFHFTQGNLLQGDVGLYWGDSLAWRTPFNPDHVPGYPLLIALLRFLTAGRLDPIVLFWAVTFCAHIVGALAVYASVASQANERIAYLSMLLFILWPFVGTTYVAFPIADSVGLALVACGVALLLSERFRTAAIPLGFATIIHKGTWIFVVLLVLAGIITHRRRFPWTALLITACPLGLLWVAGIIGNGYEPSWLLSVSLPIQFSTKSHLPVLDGIVGTVLKGGMKNVAKSVVLWAHVGLLMALFVAFCRARDLSTRWWGLALVGGLLFLYVGLNQNIIWAATRYSKIAALPVGFYLGTRPYVASALAQRRWIIAAFVVVLLASQFAYCWYMAEIVFASK